MKQLSFMGYFKIAKRPIVQSAETVVIGTLDEKPVEISRTFEGECSVWIGETSYAINSVEYQTYRRLAFG